MAHKDKTVITVAAVVMLCQVEPDTTRGNDAMTKKDNNFLNRSKEATYIYEWLVVGGRCLTQQTWHEYDLMRVDEWHSDCVLLVVGRKYKYKPSHH